MDDRNNEDLFVPDLIDKTPSRDWHLPQACIIHFGNRAATETHAGQRIRLTPDLTDD